VIPPRRAIPPRAHLLTELMRARLQMIAARYSQPRHEGRGDSGDLAAELRLIFDRIVKLLEDIGNEVSGAFDKQPTARELYAEVARKVLPRALGNWTTSCTGWDSWLRSEFWRRPATGLSGGNGPATAPSIVTTATSSTRRVTISTTTGPRTIMTRPRDTGEPSAMGPYVDYGGVDDYLVTVSVPVTNNGVFVGIMAADIRVASLERAVAPWLAQADGACILLNSASRVLLSNSVRYNVGTSCLPKLTCHSRRSGVSGGLSVVHQTAFKAFDSCVWVARASNRTCSCAMRC
jgi:hypothetical protein